MRELTDKNFGIAIAYLIPGFVVLWGSSYFSPTVLGWLMPSECSGEGSVGSFLFTLLGSLGLGLIVSAIRWAVIDTLHHATGVSRPPLDYSGLGEKLEPFVLIVEANYRFYQFYANMAVAIPVGIGCRLQAAGGLGGSGSWIIAIFTEMVLLAGSRDALRRFYSRASALLGTKPNDDLPTSMG